MNDIPVKDRRRIAEVFIKAAEMFEKPPESRTLAEGLNTDFGLCRAVEYISDGGSVHLMFGLIKANRPPTRNWVFNKALEFLSGSAENEDWYFWPTRAHWLGVKPLPRRYDLNRAKLARKIAAKLLA